MSDRTKSVREASRDRYAVVRPVGRGGIHGRCLSGHRPPRRRCRGGDQDVLHAEHLSDEAMRQSVQAGSGGAQRPSTTRRSSVCSTSKSRSQGLRSIMVTEFVEGPDLGGQDCVEAPIDALPTPGLLLSLALCDGLEAVAPNMAFSTGTSSPRTCFGSAPDATRSIDFGASESARSRPAHRHRARSLAPRPTWPRRS